MSVKQKRRHFLNIAQKMERSGNISAARMAEKSARYYQLISRGVITVTHRKAA